MEAPEGLKPGCRVRQIEIISVLGEGGMGRVYSGYDQRLKRRVALKVIRREEHRRENSRKRFLREARVLSALKHPGICQIHDIFEEPEGDFLVLEEVPGRNLQALISEGLEIEEALDIGAQILEVLMVVHREGIIHRDLKPENIMVQPDGRVKILDFGVAGAVREDYASRDEGSLNRADTGEDPGQTLTVEELTACGFRVGTLRYMSPEQARGENLGTASDIYSFGLVFREMVTGKAPFGEHLKTPILIQRVGWGDLEPVVGQSGDLRVYLERLTSPAPADRPSARDAAEQLRRIRNAPGRRRRRFLVASALVLLTLLAAGFAFQWQQARAQGERAGRLLKETRETSDFLESLFRLSDPFAREPSSGNKPVAVETLLKRGVQNIRSRFADQPLSRARMMFLLGRIERRIGHFDEAAELLEEVVAIRKNSPDVQGEELGEALLELGTIRRRQAKYSAAEDLILQAEEIAREQSGKDSIPAAEAMECLGLLRADQGLPGDAVSLLEEALRIREGSVEGRELDLALNLQTLGSCEKLLARYDKAEEHLRRSLEIVRSRQGNDVVAASSIYNEIANIEMGRGRLEQAKENYSRALNIGRRSLPGDHPLLGTFLCNLANVLDAQGEYSEAEPLYLEALSISEKSVGKDHPTIAQILLNLAMLKQHLGKLDESAELFKTSIGTMRKTIGSENPKTGLAMNSFGVLELERKNYASAQNLYVGALDIFRKNLGSVHPLTAMALNNLGEIHRLQGNYRLSEEYYRKALTAGEKAFGAENPAVAEILQGLAQTCALQGESADADRFNARAGNILNSSSAKNREFEGGS